MITKKELHNGLFLLKSDKGMVSTYDRAFNKNNVKYEVICYEEVIDNWKEVKDEEEAD